MAEGGYDIVVLGGGSGGYACALRAAELGKRVALIEKDKVGGTCLHKGCIPTKALLHSAEIADQARESEAFGVRSSFEGIDISGVQAYKDKVVERLWKGLQSTIASRKIETIDGYGKLVSPTQVQVGDTVYEAEHIVLATGSVPRSLPGLDIDGERVISSDDALRYGRVPGSVIILGGGVIGVEFASVWRSFGAEVTIVEMMPQLLPLEDESSAKLLQRAFRRRGIAFELGARFESVKHTDGGVTVTLAGGKTLDADLLLVAVGRGPVSSGLGYEDAGVEMERGYVKVDEYCRTSVPTISAVGRPDRHPAARPRRLRRGHPGRRADGGPGRHARSTTTGYRASPTPTRRWLRSASPRPQAAERGIEVTEFTYPLGGNGKSVILQTQGAAKVIAAAQEGRHAGRGAGHPPGRQPGRRADRRGPAHLQLGGGAVRRGAADPPAPHPVGNHRRGDAGAGREAPARARVSSGSTPRALIVSGGQRRSHGNNVGLRIHAPARRERHRGHRHALAEKGRRARGGG